MLRGRERRGILGSPPRSPRPAVAPGAARRWLGVGGLSKGDGDDTHAGHNCGGEALVKGGESVTGTASTASGDALPCPSTALISSADRRVIDVADKGFGLCRRRVISRVSSTHPRRRAEPSVLSNICSAAAGDRLSGGDARREPGIVDGAGRGRCTRRVGRVVSLVSRCAGAVAEHAAGVRDELEVVVRVPRSGGCRLARSQCRRCRQVRGLASVAGRQRDRARRGNGAAVAGDGEPPPERGVRVLRAPRSFRGGGRRRVGDVASSRARLLQAVPTSRLKTTADRHPPGQAQGGQADTADLERRAGGRRAGRATAGP